MRITANPGRHWQGQVELGRGDVRTLTFEASNVGREHVVIVEAAVGNDSIGVPLSRRDALRALTGLADVLGLHVTEHDLSRLEL